MIILYLHIVSNSPLSHPPPRYGGCVFHLGGGVRPFMPTHAFNGLAAACLLLLRRVSFLALMRV